MWLYRQVTTSIYAVPYVDCQPFTLSAFAAARKITSTNDPCRGLYSSNKRMMTFKETGMIHSAVSQLRLANNVSI